MYAVSVNFASVGLGFQLTLTTAVGSATSTFVPGGGTLHFSSATPFTWIQLGTGVFAIDNLALDTELPPVPILDIQLGQASYVNGETVTASVFQLANPTTEPVTVELKAWIGTPIPGLPALSVINVGADGSVVIPAGLDQDFGPFPLFLVTAAWPRGTYEFSSRILNPVTGQLLSEDLNPFAIE